MMFSPDGSPVLPLWINGRPFLTMVSDFFEVHHAQTGAPLRRTPLCGSDEVAAAVQSAQQAAPDWAAGTAAERQALLAAWAEQLQEYLEHFSKIIQEETGKTAAEAADEVLQAISHFQNPVKNPANTSPPDQGKIIALACDDSAPLAQAAALIGPVLQAGGTLILKPSPKTPGILYALVELSSLSQFPPGVVNLVQGDEQVLKAMLNHEAISRFVFSGHQALADKIATLAQPGSKPVSFEIFVS